jgi:hypothetical protein
MCTSIIKMVQSESSLQSDSMVEWISAIFASIFGANDVIDEILEEE